VDLTARAAKVYDRMATEALVLEESILTKLDQKEVRELLRLLGKVESCFHSPTDLRRMALMRAAQGIGMRATSSRPHKRHAKASINATT